VYNEPEINPPCGLAFAQSVNRLAVFYKNGAGRKNNQEINMIDHDTKRAEKAKEEKAQYDQWRELSQAHWSHWRAWGSWFSWGSLVGLGLFFISLALAAAILIWAIKL